MTWEIPVAVAVFTVLMVMLIPLGVQAVVGWVVAGEFAWPAGRLGGAVLGLLHGQFAVGLPVHVAGRMPADGVMWVLAIVGEGIVLGAALVVGLWMRDVMGGTRVRHGLATSALSADALGLPRLRRSAAVIRPDLYARRRPWSGPRCVRRGGPFR
ncbi:hypothetical protein [Nocardioides gansuensis]|uniref:hypothetical protein n=1 Tax=Nocardioides gansuensis TaxID=2138300 RepID=UPI001402EA01|nr:hypothetical protein [Nocardioides gansuensis]